VGRSKWRASGYGSEFTSFLVTARIQRHRIAELAPFLIFRIAKSPGVTGEAEPICSRAGRCGETVTSRGLTTVSGELARSRAQADDLRRKATKRLAHQPRIVWVARCDHPRVSTQPRRVFHSEDTAQRIPRADQRQLAGQKCRANSWRHWGGIVVPRPISTQKC
jgi:hypothetical protein